MIRTITVEINAAYPEMPLERAAVYTGSAVSFTILNVPRHHGKRDITSVSVSLTNASGTITTKAATREGSAWNVTLPATAVGVPGSVTNGVIISASGTMEDGETAASWILAVGDLAVLNQDGTSSPDAPRQIVHVFSSVPTAPVFGDIAVVESVLKIRWSDGTWKDMGGGGSITLEDEVTQSSSNGVKSSGIWSFVKGLLPNWLTSSYAEPATVSSVSAKADKAVPAAANNFAALDSSGNLVDSTKKAADFAAASHTHTKIVDGVKEIAADLTAKVATGGYTDWEPSETTARLDPYGVYYKNCNIKFSHDIADVWTSLVYESTDGITWTVTGPEVMYGDFVNPNATTLTFPDGTPTHRVPVTATKTIATTDQVPTVVSPSTASTDAGKAADAKATGDALAAKATQNDITSAISAHNAANDAHADIRTTVGAKVASLSCGSGASQQTITPVNGVADVSSLFTSANTSYNASVMKISSEQDAPTVKDYIDTKLGEIESALAAILGGN